MSCERSSGRSSDGGLVVGVDPIDVEIFHFLNDKLHAHVNYVPLPGSAFEINPRGCTSGGVERLLMHRARRVEGQDGGQVFTVSAYQCLHEKCNSIRSRNERIELGRSFIQ